MVVDNGCPPPPFASGSARSHPCPFSFSLPISGWGDFEQIVHSTVEYSLVFVVNVEEKKVLLGLKRRGFGAQLYNGFGGKRDQHETMLECAARELKEESGLVPERLDPRGHIYILRPSPNQEEQTKFMIHIHLFSCDAWQDTPCSTEEMIPKWFSIQALPFDQMWPDASFYLPPLLNAIILNQFPSQRLLARVDYELLSISAAPTSHPSLDEVQAIARQISSPPAVGKQERLSGWWMCLASIDAAT